MKLNSSSLRFPILTALAAAICIFILWDPTPTDLLEVGNATSSAHSDGASTPTGVQTSQPTGENEEDPARSKAQYSIPVFVQLQDGNQWTDAAGIEISYFCESFRNWKDQSLADFDVHNPWRNSNFSNLPTATTNGAGKAIVETNKEDLWLYARNGDAVLIHWLRADRNWNTAAEEGVLCSLEPCEAIQFTVTLASGAPAANVPVQVASFRSGKGTTGKDGVAEIFLNKHEVLRRENLRRRGPLTEVQLVASLNLLDKPNVFLHGFDQGKRTAELRLPRCSKVVVNSKQVGFSGGMRLQIESGNFARSVRMLPDHKMDRAQWKYDYAPLGQPLRILLYLEGLEAPWRVPLDVLRGRTSAKSGGLKELEVNWDSVFLATGRVQASPQYQSRSNVLRVISLNDKGQSLGKPIQVQTSPEGDFEIAFTAPGGDVGQIRHLWLQSLEGKRENVYSLDEYFVQNLDAVPGEQIQLGTLAPGPIEPLVSGTAAYDDGELFFGYGLRAVKRVPRADGQPDLWLAVNMKNTGTANSVGFNGKFAATHAKGPFPFRYQLSAKIKDCLRYQQEFQPGSDNFEVIFQLLSTVTGSYRAEVFAGDQLDLVMIDEKGKSYRGSADLQFGLRTPPREEGEFSKMVFRELPPGNYLFRAQVWNGGILKEIPFVKVAGLDTAPPELQKIVIEQPGAVRLKLVDESGDAMDLSIQSNHFVTLYESTDDGYLPSFNYSHRENQVRIAEASFKPGNYLVVNGYHPIELKGLDDGDEIEMRRSPILKVNVEPLTEAEEFFPYTLAIEPIFDAHNSKTLPLGPGGLSAQSRWEYNFACPGKGKYQVRWYLLLDSFGGPGQRIQTYDGPILELDPIGNPAPIQLQLPPDLIAEAKRRGGKDGR